ncbi:MAG: helix-turn-helix domain-containing protein, partial [Steroidobacteraceae bacterium]
RRACLLSPEPVIAAAALSLPPTSASRDEPVLDRASVEQALERARGIVAHAARDLGLTRQALYRRMEKLGIKAEPSSEP